MITHICRFFYIFFEKFSLFTMKEQVKIFYQKVPFCKEDITAIIVDFRKYPPDIGMLLLSFRFSSMKDTVEINRQRFGWSSESHASGLCRSDAFRLALANVCALIFCHERKNLQHNIIQKCSHQVFAPAGI